MNALQTYNAGDGTVATVIWLNAEHQPVAPERATSARVTFSDGESAVFAVERLATAEWNEDLHPRDSSGRFSHSLSDSLKDPGTMSFEEFSKPAPLPPIPEGHVRLVHVTDAKNVHSILKEGLQRSKSRGSSYGEPSVVWATSLGEQWGGTLTPDSRAIIFDVSKSEASNAGTLWQMGDVSPKQIVAVDRAGFSNVSTGSLTVRQERQTPDADERRLYWEEYRRQLKGAEGWNEDLHPRDETGKFTDSGGALSGGKVKSSEKVTGSANAVEKITLVDEHGKTIDAIFKPVAGESWTNGDMGRRQFVNTYGVEPDSELGQRIIAGDEDDPAIRDLPAFDPDDYGDPEDDSPVRDTITNRDFTYAEREAAAYEVDRTLGLGVVPPTVIREVGGQQGMVQEFVEADDRYSARKLDPDSIYGAAILDIAIGNTDRHEGNYLVSGGKFVALDHGLSFPESADEFRPDAVVRALSDNDAARMTPEFAARVKERLEDADWEKISDKWHLSPREEEHFFHRISRLQDAFASYEQPEDGIKDVLAELSAESGIAGEVPWR